MEPNLAGSIYCLYVRSYIKLLHLVPFSQQTWLLLQKIEHMVIWWKKGNNSKIGNGYSDFLQDFRVVRSCCADHFYHCQISDIINGFWGISRSTYPAILKLIWVSNLELLLFFHQIFKILILFVLYFKNYKRSMLNLNCKNVQYVDIYLHCHF
jgi:hypothetical protein